MINILVVGDCHVDDTQDLRRFTWLSNYIVDHRPSIILFIGDFLSLNSLSSWDTNNRYTMEGRRYQKELQSGNKALDLALKGIEDVNSFRRSIKKKLYKPRLVFIKGNHEYRLDRYVEKHPELYGKLDVSNDLRLVNRGFEVIPYKYYIQLYGIDFTHVPFDTYAKPITTHNMVSKIGQLSVNSTVFGHHHTLDFGMINRRGQQAPQMILCVGCFFEHTEAYMQGSVENYWRGLVNIEVHKTGQFDFSTICLDVLRGLYSV